MAGITNVSGFTNVITAALNGLTAGGTASSLVLTPPTGPHPFYMEFALVVPQSYTPNASTSFEVYVREAVETGSPPAVFEDISSSSRVGTLVFATAAATNHAAKTPALDTPATPFIVTILSASGSATLPASGNVLRVNYYSAS
jgi:hypothetical protein